MLCRALRYQITGAVALALVASSLQAAPVPVVDTAAPSAVTAVTREQLENLPVGRRLEDLIAACPRNTIPTVSRQPDILVDGKPTIDLDCVQPADIEMIEVLKVHNSVRAEYGAWPLAWDPALAQGAQGYVNIISRTGQLTHASREGRGTVRENLSQGLPNYRSRQLMDNWLNERRYFLPGTFPNVSTTGDWYQVGHFSQMLWPTTTTIGCARGLGMGSSWLVCRYNPGGNKDGQTVGIPLQTQQVATVTTPADNGPEFAPSYPFGPVSVGAYYPDAELQWEDQALRDAFAEIRIPILSDPLILGLHPGDCSADSLPSSYISMDQILSFSAADVFSFSLGLPDILNTPPPPPDSPARSNYYDALGRYVFAGCKLEF